MGWDDGINGPDQEPNVYTMLRGIMGNNLEYLYTRLVRPNSYANNDGIIEIAWRIPPGGGTGANNPDIYR
jgi:chitinase